MVFIAVGRSRVAVFSPWSQKNSGLLGSESERRQATGIGERRHGDPVLLISSEDDLRELGMLRYALEVGSIERAIQHATEEQIGQLASIVTKMEAAFGDAPQSVSCHPVLKCSAR